MQRATQLLVAVAFATLSNMAACSSFGDTSEPAPDGGADPDSGLADTSTTPDHDGGAVTDAADGFPRTPLGLVTIGGSGGVKFWVETKEVTIGQFTAFQALLSSKVSFVDAGYPCEGKMTFGHPLGCTRNPDGDDDPATCVDWCDAHAYCSAIGRRLCGAIGGHEQPSGSYADPATDQWYRACRGSAGNAHPYGPVSIPDTCASSEVHEGGAKTGCVTPESGLFDMTGNVAEWEDACIYPAGRCRVRGGEAARETEDELRCDLSEERSPPDFGPTLGFRCCSDTATP